MKPPTGNTARRDERLHLPYSRQLSLKQAKSANRRCSSTTSSLSSQRLSLKNYKKNVRLVASNRGCDIRSVRCDKTRTRSPTFHCHWYSSTTGGLVVFLGLHSDSPYLTSSSPFLPSSTSPGGGLPLPLSPGYPSCVAISSNSSNSSFVECSLNAAFSVDLNSYLNAHESVYRYKIVGRGRVQPVTPEE